MATSSLDPPPTINNLGRQQRMQLVRSNRKLEAVLGAAPLYVETEIPSHFEPTPKATRREGRLYNHSPSPSFDPSSSTSLHQAETRAVVNPLKREYSPVHSNSKSGPKTMELSRPVLLRLRALPIPLSDNRTSLSSPRFASVISPPNSPTFTINLDTLQSSSLETRRKKIAKLERTFGENIPPQLVFPLNSPNDTPETSPKSRRMDRRPLPAIFTAPAPLSRYKSAEASTLPISRPKPMSSRKIPPPPSIPPSLPATNIQITPPPRLSSRTNTEPTKPTVAERRGRHRPRSLSLSTGTDVLIAAAQARTQTEAAKSRSPATIPASVTRKDLTIEASIDVYLGSPAYDTVGGKATKDVLASRSPLPFQTNFTDTSPHVSQHRHAHSSPVNEVNQFGFDDAEARPKHHHSKSISPTSLGSASSYMGISKKSTGPPSAFNYFGKRKEKGWSGEWNQDMGEVVKTLRNLKAR